MLNLQDSEPLACGHLRAVYQHPEQADRLIKIMRPEIVNQRWGGILRWYKRLPRARHYSGFVRELKEYIAFKARYPQALTSIAPVWGVVETDLGLGLIVQKIVGPQGDLAPTFKSYIEQYGYTADMAAELKNFFQNLLKSNIVIGDIHLRNIVYGCELDGPSRLIMIDGFGEKNIIPKCSMSRWINRRNTLRHWRRVEHLAVTHSSHRTMVS